MIELANIRYCRLGTPDLASAERFATHVLGLEVADRSRGAVYFKSDDRDHTLCYFEGTPDDQTTAFELNSSAELSAAAGVLEQLGHAVDAGTSDQCDARRVREFIGFNDPSGNRIELVVRPYASPNRYHGTRDAGITGFSHIGMFSTDMARDEAFWTNVCNARVSDWVGPAALLRIDEIHHSIALVPGGRHGLHHINHQVEDTDAIQRANRLLLDAKIPITYAPGRHAASGAQFVYFSGHDSLVYEYSMGVMLIDDEPMYRERDFPGDPRGQCIWGGAPAH